MSGRSELDDDLMEMRFRRVVVGEDNSSASQVGLAAAVRLARRDSARVTVVHVRHQPLVMCLAGLAALAVSGAEELMRALDSLEEEARSRAARAFAGSGVRWDFLVRAGQPGKEILRAVERLGADLVVIGSNRHSTVHNALLGSTTAYVTAHSPVPVLVVRSPRPDRARRPLRTDVSGPALTVLPS